MGSEGQERGHGEGGGGNGRGREPPPPSGMGLGPSPPLSPAPAPPLLFRITTQRPAEPPWMEGPVALFAATQMEAVLLKAEAIKWVGWG